MKWTILALAISQFVNAEELVNFEFTKVPCKPDWAESEEVWVALNKLPHTTELSEIKGCVNPESTLNIFGFFELNQYCRVYLRCRNNNESGGLLLHSIVAVDLEMDSGKVAAVSRVLRESP
ncbi:hypothetical protein [Microbulbifer sp. ARAS458-1]|uniref:hypothetical protein n=1 Tax=Microbulbifer sp. ARAS458-1 TaxID=3140242 RepID=UPI00387841D8